MKGEVQVYRNLHKNRPDGGAVYSVRNADGIVEDHTSFIALSDCKLRVSDKGNKRVRDEKRKNVHAYIQGKREDIFWTPTKTEEEWAVEITYNPYKYDSFVRKDTEQPVKTAKAVYINSKQVMAIIR